MREMANMGGSARHLWASGPEPRLLVTPPAPTADAESVHGRTDRLKARTRTESDGAMKWTA